MRRLCALLVICAAPSALADFVQPGIPLKLENYQTGLSQLTDFQFLPDGRVVATQRTGEVVLRQASGALKTMHTFPADSSHGERGLLGVAVDPEFQTNRRLFFYYSRTDAVGGTANDRHRVVSITMKSDDTLDATTEKILVAGLRGPANHDGGGLAIGPDGKLYIGVGDTGCNCSCAPGSATNTFGTCLTNGNGKILRVNLDGSIPSDNPLVGQAAVTACGSTCTSTVSASTTGAPRTDIYAWGFRNPFRFGFDPRTGNFWVGDVGEVTWEELNIVQKGKHYGWPWREGAEGDSPGTCASVTPLSGNCVDPVFACKHGDQTLGVDDCKSMTAGTFVDDCSWPAGYRGQYYFTDGDTGFISRLSVDASRAATVGATPRTVLARVTGGVGTATRIGPDGQLYISVYGATSSRIVKISPTAPEACDAGTGGGGGSGGGGGALGSDAGGTGDDAGLGGSGGSMPDGGGGVGAGKGCGCAATPSELWVTCLVALRAARRKRGAA